MSADGVRSLWDAISHTPLKDGGQTFPTVSGKLGYIFALAIDALIEKADQGVKARIPTLCDPSALVYIGADRQMPQGAGESTAGYRLRLQRAWDTWARAGNSRTVLGNVLPMLAPFTPLVRTVSDVIEWYTYDAGADTSQPPWHYSATTPPIGLWNWDGLIPLYDPHAANQVMWWRWWLLLFAVSPNNFCNPGANWGDPGVKWGDTNRSWGTDRPASFWSAMRPVIAQWKQAGSWCRWIVVSFDLSLFDPFQPDDGVHNPDGLFGRWSKIVSGQYVPSRFSNARYIDGVS